MLRTLLGVGLIAMAGIFALKIVFGLLGPLVALLIWLIGLALKLSLAGLVLYFILRVVSPTNADKLRDTFRNLLD